jgi:hypothetical protein
VLPFSTKTFIIRIRFIWIPNKLLIYCSCLILSLQFERVLVSRLVNRFDKVYATDCPVLKLSSADYIGLKTVQLKSFEMLLWQGSNIFDIFIPGKAVELEDVISLNDRF